MRTGGPNRQSGHFGKEKTFVLLWESEHNFSVVQATTQGFQGVTYKEYNYNSKKWKY